jgi:surface polysaccharide O-acyltransferase-like enzyme
MYIGLYLIIPFLNIGYKALGSKNKKLLLIFVLLVLNALPKTTNIIIFIFPDYWQITYPLSFYFIGSFLSEYNIKFESKLKGLLMLFAGLIADYVFRLYLFNKHGASSQRKSDDLIYIFISVVLFVLINSIDFKREFKIVTSISKMSFSMYLLSYIVDKYIYSLLFNSDMRYGEKFKYIFISVPLVAIISYLLALIVNFIYGIFKKIDKPISDKIYPILESMIKKLALKLDSKDKSLTEKT